MYVKKREQTQEVVYERRKARMVNAQAISSKGMYIYTSVFACICYRRYIHKINLTCHKHM